jgi:hypothetical protein
MLHWGIFKEGLKIVNAPLLKGVAERSEVGGFFHERDYFEKIESPLPPTLSLWRTRKRGIIENKKRAWISKPLESNLRFFLLRCVDSS